MYRYNDYQTLTKEHLRNYVYYEQAIINLTADVTDIRHQLADESVKTSSYGPELPGGTGELNGTERAADNRIRLREKCPDLLRSLHRLQKLVQRLRENIQLLPEDEKEVIELFYCQRLSYSAISRKKHLSERSCRRKVDMGVRSLSLMIYGLCAQEDVFFIGKA